jgi:selenocysteine-specific elongation factor
MHLVIGTAGHIDHGKSSLVQALTGTDPDRLPEEKARGVTIDLGFAHLSLPDPEKNTTYELGIIDVPGHADFVNNMVSGVGALDLALFIIAADDGWMPQSEEHLHILTYNAIKRVIIPMTKADLCEDVPFSVEVLRDELQGTPIAEAPIIPVSSITGEGIDTLKSTLLKELRNCTPPVDAGKPRLSIDRLFSPKGTGTVVTGTLSGGNVHTGDTLTLQPQGLSTRVRYIQNHSQSLETAHPGMRTALNLPDLPIHAPGKPGAQRGNTLVSANCGTPTDTLDIHLTRLERSIPGNKPRPLRHTETVILHHGSARCRARIVLHGCNHLNPGEETFAQLRLETPIFLLTGDKVVLRDGAQQNTLAGGTVLDAHPARQGFRNDDRSAFLAPRAQHPDDLLTYLKTQLQRDHRLDPANPLPNNPFSEHAIQQSIDSLIQSQAIHPIGSHLLSARWWKGILKQAEATVKSWHRQHPDLPNMPVEEFETTLTDCPEDLLALVPEALAKIGYKYSAKTIAHPNHSLSLPDDIAAEANHIIATLERSGLQPPNRADLAPGGKSEQALKFLIRSGKAIELEPKVIIARSARDKAIESVRSFISSHPDQRATASELRQHLDSTRKIVMPLLEHLDALGITVRNDNFRRLK